MTTSEFYKQMAEMAAKCEALEAEVLTLRGELAEARAAAAAVEPKPWLTTAEAEKYLGISKSKLEKTRCRGQVPLIPFRKSGRSIHYFRGDLDEYSRNNLKGRKKTA